MSMWITITETPVRHDLREYARRHRIEVRQQCALCGAFLPKPTGKTRKCGRCGTEWEA